MNEILNIIAQFLIQYGTEMLTLGVSALIALVKRWLDKKGIRKGLEERGVATETINQVLKIKIKA